MHILTYSLNVVSLILMVSASLIKGKKMTLILFLVFMANFLFATSYILDGHGINGAATCYLGAVQTIINYFFTVRNRDIPKKLIAVYALSFIMINIAVSGGITPLGLLVIVASLCFVLCINQKNGAKYRFWTFINISLWCVYDILSGAFNGLITHFPQLIFLVVGIIIHDRK